jgi:hypothetical protein
VKEEQAKKEREARDREKREKEEKEKKEKAEKERIAREKKEEKERKAAAERKEAEERKAAADKAAEEERLRKEAEAKLAAQQREKAKAEKKEKAAAAAPIPIPPAATPAKSRAPSRSSATPGVEQMSPSKTSLRPSSAFGSAPGPSMPNPTPKPQQKQPFQHTYPARMPVGPKESAGFRPPPGNFAPSISPGYTGQNGGPIMNLGSLPASARPFAHMPHEASISPPYDMPRTALGHGFPDPLKPPGMPTVPSYSQSSLPQHSLGQMSHSLHAPSMHMHGAPGQRVPSLDDAFASGSKNGPIGGRTSSMSQSGSADIGHLGMTGLSLDDYRPQPPPIGAGAPIAPPQSAPAPAAPPARSPTKATGERVLGSSALASNDDEIVAPPSRHLNGWNAPPIMPGSAAMPAALSGASRWSAGAGIWGAPASLGVAPMSGIGGDAWAASNQRSASLSAGPTTSASSAFGSGMFGAQNPPGNPPGLDGLSLSPPPSGQGMQQHQQGMTAGGKGFAAFAGQGQQ